MEKQTFYSIPFPRGFVVTLVTWLTVVLLLAAVCLGVAQAIPMPVYGEAPWRILGLGSARAGLTGVGLIFITSGIISVLGSIQLRRTMIKRPALIIEEERLVLPGYGIAIKWQAIKGFTRGNFFATPLVGVLIVNTDTLVRRVPLFLKFIYRIRIRACGSPFTIPPVREMSLGELYDLLEERRQAAIAKSA
jgi:hypothetical protein